MLSQTYSQTLGYLRKYKSQAGLNVLFNVLTTFFSIVSFVVLKPFLDILFLQNQTPAPSSNLQTGLGYYTEEFSRFLSQYIADEGRYAGLLLVCGIILGSFFLKNLFRYLALLVMSPVRNGIERDIRQNLFDKIQLLPLSFFSNEKKGDLLSRFGADVQEIQWGVLRSLESVVRSPVAIVGSLVVMLYISPSLTLFSFVLMLGVGGIIGRIGKKLKSVSKDSQNTLGGLTSIVEETLGGLRIIKAFQVENYQSSQFERLNEHYYRTQVSIQARKDLSSPLTEFLGVGIVAVLLLFGGSLVFEGYFEPSTFVVFVMMFYNIIEPAKNLSASYYDIQKAKAAIERIQQILAVKEEESKPASSSQPAPAPNSHPQAGKADISYQNVSFSYQADKPILQNVSLEIPFGQTLAIVGGSGGGKSTLVDLLPRFYQPNDGRILINGEDISGWGLSELRKMFAIVSQEPILFNDTISNNIALGLDNADKEAIIQAAKLANAHDFILKTPQGYDSYIGDRGGNLSGGQRQRLTLARAILKNAPILILDEATSALDSESEQLIQQSLQQLKGSKTILLIAHKLNTVQQADKIIVINNGSIVESGKHETLMQQQGYYYRLFNSQG